MVLEDVAEAEGAAGLFSQSLSRVKIFLSPLSHIIRAGAGREGRHSEAVQGGVGVVAAPDGLLAVVEGVGDTQLPGLAVRLVRLQVKLCAGLGGPGAGQGAAGETSQTET